MKELAADEVLVRSAEDLGLTWQEGDECPSSLAAALIRRAAGIYCPSRRTTLINAVRSSLEKLLDADDLQDVLADALDGIIAYGDLQELPDDGVIGSGAGNMVYLAAPAFVVRRSGVVYLVGVAPDRGVLLSDELEQRVEYVSHVRRLTPQPGEDLQAELQDLHLRQIPSSVWLAPFPKTSPAEHRLKYDRLLNDAPSRGDVPGLEILDASAKVTFYTGRKAIPKHTHSGRFVGRRSQTYGGGIWCYVELEKGHPTRLLDFPTPGSRQRGCDEAWQLLCALDASCGRPQAYRVRPLAEPRQDELALDVFSPVPLWVESRWLALGRKIGRGNGALLSYSLPACEIPEEVTALRERLWLEELGPSTDDTAA